MFCLSPIPIFRMGKTSLKSVGIVLGQKSFRVVHFSNSAGRSWYTEILVRVSIARVLVDYCSLIASIPIFHSYFYLAKIKSFHNFHTKYRSLDTSDTKWFNIRLEQGLMRTVITNLLQNVTRTWFSTHFSQLHHVFHTCINATKILGVH